MDRDLHAFCHVQQSIGLDWSLVLLTLWSKFCAHKEHSVADKELQTISNRLYMLYLALICNEGCSVLSFPEFCAKQSSSCSVAASALAAIPGHFSWGQVITVLCILQGHLSHATTTQLMALDIPSCLV